MEGEDRKASDPAVGTQENREHPEPKGHPTSQAYRGRRWALLCAVAALLVRLVYLLESGENPFRVHLDLDPRFYHHWALAILSGQWIGAEPFAQAPLYPYFLAACYALLGPHPLRIFWLQAVLGAVTVYLGARVAGRHWGHVALVATGVLLAFYGPAIFYTGVLLVPVLATLLLSLTLWLAPRHPLPAGLAAGLTALAHPTAFPGALVALFALLWLDPPGDRQAGRSRARRLALMGAGLVIALAPATSHNLVASGRFVPLSVNGGINLYIGNGPQANGFYRAPPGMSGDEDPLGIAAASRRLDRPVTAVEANRFWTKATWEHVREDPPAALALMLRKVYLALAAYETPQIESYDFEQRYSILLRLPLLSSWLALLTLTAVALFLRRRDRLLTALALGVLANTAVLAVYFVTGRFRMPTHLLLALGSGAAMAALAGIVSDSGREGLRRRWRRLLPAGAVAVVVLIAFGPNWMAVGKHLIAGQYHFRLGILAEREGRLEEAAEQYRTALTIDPLIAPANINLGVLTARQGDLQQARRLLERGVSLDARSARGHLALGQIHQLRGDLAAACSLYARAWEADTTFTTALEFLAAGEYLRGNLPDAARHAAELLDREGEGAALAARSALILQRLAERRRWGLALAGSRARREADLALGAGRLQRAEAAYREALRADPEDAAALLELTRIAAAQGEPDSVAIWKSRFVAAGGPAAALEGIDESSR